MKKSEEIQRVSSGILGSLLCACGLHHWIKTDQGVRFCIRCGWIPRARSRSASNHKS